MQKKLLCALLAIMVFSVPVFAAANFSDLPDSHWGYVSVARLVNSGTINGYQDGTFRPSGAVTRAEFVKMMGEGTVRRGSDFSDVAPDHWAYNYVMTSQFDDGTNEFKPSQPITREETVVLLWKRMGAPTGYSAPDAVAAQATNKEAVAWAYSNEIMRGDDGVNMRLGGTLSRVEAAALIVRTSDKDEALLKRIFESFHLFDNNPAYSPEKTMTNGELSRAALRIASSEYNITYGNYPFKAQFEHAYAKDVAIMSNICFGADKANAEFADKTATKEDLVAALTAAVIRKANTPVSYGATGNYYRDITGAVDSKENVYLTFAYTNGIGLYGNQNIGAGEPATYKDIAIVLLQLDNLIGTQTVISTKKAGEKFVKSDVKLNHDLKTYPSNNGNFVCISQNVSNAVYEKEFAGKKLQEKFDFAREFGDMFANALTKITDNVKKAYGIDMELVIYPELVWDDVGVGFVLRPLCRINDVPEKPVLINTVFAQDELTEEIDGFIKKGMEFFVNIKLPYYALLT